jgi:uncharacterized protein with HEPN domain
VKHRERVYSDYLHDMEDAAQKAEDFVKGLSFEQFKANDEKVFAVIRALEIIGEASKRIPPPCKAKVYQASLEGDSWNA